MKILLKKTLFFSLVLGTTLLCSCKSNDPEEKKQDTDSNVKKAELQGSSKEAIIELDRHAVDANYGNLRIGLSQYTILVDSTKSLNVVLDKIHEKGLATLKKLATGLVTTLPERYLLAVKITYGLDQNKEMKLYYQPVFLKNVSENPSQTDNAKFEPIVSPFYYEYSAASSDFTEVKAIDVIREAITSYTTHISFKQKNNRYFRNFKNTSDDDSTADVKSVTYPIQEFDSIMTANKVHEIYIFNAAEEIYAKHDWHLKHSIILGPGELQNTKAFVYIFAKKYGNLSHLCPPSCNNAPKLFNIKLP